MNSILQNLMFVFMLLVTSFSNCQSFSWPPWIQNESCYERIVICERYDRNNPTCSNQAGHLGSNGFRIIGGRNELEIEGRSVFFQPDGDLIIGGSVWKTTIGLTKGTSVLTTSYNIDLIDCPRLIRVTFGNTVTANYSFHCGNDSEVVEPAQTGIVYFKDLGICGNNKNVILVAVRQGTTVSTVSTDFNGCLYEVDDTWNIMWPDTLLNHLSIRPCPNRNDHVTGEATRYCDSHGSWSEPNVLNCVSTMFLGIEQLAQSILNTSNPETQISLNNIVIQQLIQVTEPQTHSLLPIDLQISTRVLSTLIGVLEDNENTTNENVIDIFDNLLEESNREGWSVLQHNKLENGGEQLLDNAERYAKVVANISEAFEGEARKTLSRSNIVVSVEQINRTSISDLQFPTSADLVNYTASNSSSKITIPKSFMDEKMNMLEIPSVSFILFRFLPMGDFILANSTTLVESECSSQLQSTRSSSDILSAQIGLRTGNVSLNASKNSVRFQTENLVKMNFTFPIIDSNSLYLCVFWNFSDPIGNGSWATSGVTTDDIRTVGNLTTVQCSSTHLTSFAVLVDVTGGLRGIGTSEKRALQIVSYIGCGISMTFLIATIIFFVLYGKKLFTSVNFFIHLNLSISLLLALIVFVSGIETATTSQILCIVVAALLHYFFLSAFCWMLCEGIMLYLLLVVVFSKMARQWWPFFVVGYFPAMPIVAVTVGVRYKYFGIKGACGELLYCWLSVDHGTIFGFVGPMILIILVNIIFLMLALRTLWRSKRGQLKREKDTKAPQKLARALFVASVVLLPLLGLTWVFGILTVNANSTIFAWLFTIFNSLQGMFIFFFHVVRSDKVWSRISAAASKLKLHRVKQNNFGSTESSQFKMKKAQYQHPYSAYNSKQNTCKPGIDGASRGTEQD